MPKLSGNALKLIAAAAMAADHIGLMFFPEVEIFRLIGRFAMPIFAFMIAEGCRYTRNRARYFGQIFTLGAVCQIVYYVAMRDTYLSILITFSLSILTIYTWQSFRARRSLPSALIFAVAVAGVWCLNRVLTIDYGFWGCMTPVAASIFMPRRGETVEGWEAKLDRIPVHVGMMATTLLPLAIEHGGRQYLALAAIPLLMLYSGERGKWRMKYFFYIFYPAHLAILNGIDMLLRAR